MKFTDGFWLIRDGFDVQYARHVQAARTSNNRLHCLVTPKVVKHRGATLNTSTLDVEISSPLLDVIRIEISHHKGGTPALKFDLNRQKVNIRVNEEPNFILASTWA